MNEQTFLAALHQNPSDEVTWLALSDWLEENGQTQRAELVRLVRRLRTLPAMKRSKGRVELEARVAELLSSGVRPTVPEVVNSLGMRFALIPPGRFRMGSPRTEKDRSSGEVAHEVEITRPFYLGVFPVTQKQYQAITRKRPSDHCSAGDEADQVEGLDTSDFPVESVSWEEAIAFCERLSKRAEEKKAGRTYRLPSEAEWEYACRGGWVSTTAFILGKELDPSHANFDAHFSTAGPDPRPCPVGSYPPNAFGLYDMIGNVWEWCQDRYDGRYYSSSPRQDPPGPTSGSDRVVRGGCWDGLSAACRIAYRLGSGEEFRDNYTGFRVALSLASQEA
jgi:uncharacterized protein (TIGR02996 family)